MLTNKVVVTAVPTVLCYILHGSVELKFLFQWVWIWEDTVIAWLQSCVIFETVGSADLFMRMHIYCFAGTRNSVVPTGI